MSAGREQRLERVIQVNVRSECFCIGAKFVCFVAMRSELLLEIDSQSFFLYFSPPVCVLFMNFTVRHLSRPSPIKKILYEYVFKYVFIIFICGHFETIYRSDGRCRSALYHNNGYRYYIRPGGGVCHVNFVFAFDDNENRRLLMLRLRFLFARKLGTRLEDGVCIIVLS